MSFQEIIDLEKRIDREGKRRRRREEREKRRQARAERGNKRRWAWIILLALITAILVIVKFF